MTLITMFTEPETVPEELQGMLYGSCDIQTLATKVITLSILAETQEPQSENFYQKIGGIITYFASQRTGFYEALQQAIREAKPILDEMSELRRTRCLLYNQI